MEHQKKKVTELIEGDVFLYENNEYTFVHKVKRYSGRYDVYCHNYKELSLYPEDEVLYVGKCEDPSCWSDDEKLAYTRKMWSELRKRIPSAIVKILEKQYYASLFGKRGTYSEQDRTYFTDNYRDVCNIKSILDGGDNIAEVHVSTYDDIDTSYSSQYETECYGWVALYIYIKTKNNEHYQLSQGKMSHISKETYEYCCSD